jgi:hypothetical protein
MIDRRPPRPEGWEGRLSAALAAGHGRAWRWGAHDCVGFAFGVARAMLGGATAWDPWAEPYGSAFESALLVRRGGGLVAMLDRGAPQIPPAFALRGDVAVMAGGLGRVATGGGVVVGVVSGPLIWCAHMPGGLLAMPLAAALHAWPVDFIGGDDG